VSARQKPLFREVASFVQYHLGKDCFAPHTGQDWPAWRAFVYLVECYSHGGGQDAILAMRATVRCAQPHAKVLRTFVQVIPAVMDWGDVSRLWPQVAEGILVRDNEIDARQITAIERFEVGRNGLGKKTRLHGWQPRDLALRDEIEGSR
jgi:hypothetical protein